MRRTLVIGELSTKGRSERRRRRDNDPVEPLLPAGSRHDSAPWPIAGPFMAAQRPSDDQDRDRDDQPETGREAVELAIWIGDVESHGIRSFPCRVAVCLHSCRASLVKGR